MQAPVLPADTTPCAFPSRTRRHATRMEESFFERTAFAAESSMVMTSLAATISIGSRASFGIWHFIFLLYFLERGPAVVGRRRLALALVLIPVAPAHRANSFTRFTAYALHR